MDELKDALNTQDLRPCIKSEERYAAAVREGLAAWEAGDVVDHADVEAAFTRLYGHSV